MPYSEYDVTVKMLSITNWPDYVVTDDDKYMFVRMMGRKHNIHNFSSYKPDPATDVCLAMPGTLERIRTYRARISRGEEIFCQDDATSWEETTSSEEDVLWAAKRELYVYGAYKDTPEEAEDIEDEDCHED
jgi:hypothetical protein